MINNNINNKQQITKKNNKIININYAPKEVKNPLWLSITEAAKIGGVQNKTIRRAIQAKTIKFKIIGNRYLVEFASMLLFMGSKTKLKNKFNQCGVGQYVEKWRK